MESNEISFLHGENTYQTAEIELNDKMIDYETSSNLTYVEMVSIIKGLDVISEFYDVNAAVSVHGAGICAVALSQSQADSVAKVLDSNPIDFMYSVIVVSKEVDSETVKFLKSDNLIVAPSYTKKAIEYLQTHDIKYVTIKTPLKEYKNYLSNEVKQTPLGTLIQSPNKSELNKDTFKVLSKIKPTVEQIEDAVFAWKVAKHCKSRSIVVAKDLKTSAISQGLLAASVEYALDYSCDLSKESVIAFDMNITSHDVNVASQGRVSVIILPKASPEIVKLADKYSMVVIETGYTNILL
jgi:phosphoribosylaminoimidazolecarboxamide formyltransferase/IMP cyclohydrolase